MTTQEAGTAGFPGEERNGAGISAVPLPSALSESPAPVWDHTDATPRTRSNILTGPPPGTSSRRAPRVFFHTINRLHRLLPRAVRRRVPVTFIGYAIINGSAFLIDIGFLWLFYEKLHWFYPLAVTVGYAIAGAYSLLLNRWLNFQSHGHLASQGSRYAIGLASQYVIFILGLTSFLHWIGVHAELARFVSACCEGVYLYALMRIWVFRGVPEPDDEDEWDQDGDAESSTVSAA